MPCRSFVPVNRLLGTVGGPHEKMSRVVFAEEFAENPMIALRRQIDEFLHLRGGNRSDIKFCVQQFGTVCSGKTEQSRNPGKIPVPFPGEKVEKSHFGKTGSRFFQNQADKFFGPAVLVLH